MVLKQRIDDTEDLIDIDLDQRRNELEVLNIMVTTITLAFSFISMVSSLLVQTNLQATVTRRLCTDVRSSCIVQQTMLSTHASYHFCTIAAYRGGQWVRETARKRMWFLRFAVSLCCKRCRRSMCSCQCGLF